MPRVLLNGTPHEESDWTLSSGWGSNATVNTQVSNDQAGEVLIVPAGSGISANPTVKLTYRDGAWPVRPVNVHYNRPDRNTPKTAHWALITNNDNEIEFSFIGLPRKNMNYALNYLIFGR